MSAAAKVLIVDDLQPYQRKFFGMDVATKPDRTVAVVAHRDTQRGFAADLIIWDGIGYSDDTWAVIRPKIVEARR